MAQRQLSRVASAAAADAQRYVWQTHPLYQQWQPVWRLLGEVYEGDGGFLDGTALVAHPRELVYPVDANKNIDMTKPAQEKDKFKRRKALARYENFAQSMVDLFVDHQYMKGVSRTFEGLALTDYASQPIVAWWKDVDGLGTSLDDWLKYAQVMAHVFGHIFVVMDRNKPETQQQVVSAADEGRLYLRVYTPLDALDWLAPTRKLTAIKFIEAVERASLEESSTYAADAANSGNLLVAQGTNSVPHVQYRTWTKTQWSVFRKDGTLEDSGANGFGELPVLTFYSRRRPRIPIIGRSLLRDPKLFKDHFNLVSELRELIRSQCFSMLHIRLGETEEVSDARGRLGDHAGTDTILWTKGEAQFIAAPDGPAATLMKEIGALERKMFRLIGIGEDTDSHEAETEGSRRLKAMDMNRMLGGCAAEAQRFEEALHRLWYIGTYGPDLGQKRWTASGLQISHPDEFYVEEMQQTIEETLGALEVPLGPTFSKQIRKRAVPHLLPDASDQDIEDIHKEIDDLVDKEVANAEAAEQAAADALHNVRWDQMGRLQPPPPVGQEAPPQPGQPGAPKPKVKTRKPKLKPVPAATPPAA